MGLKVFKTSQYDRWFKKIKDATAKARINVRIRRIELAEELVGDWKPVGDKVIELRIDAGPGYRIYGHVEGKQLLLLLIGGDKSTQRADIRKAKELLRDWEARDGR